MLQGVSDVERNVVAGYDQRFVEGDLVAVTHQPSGQRSCAGSLSAPLWHTNVLRLMYCARRRQAALFRGPPWCSPSSREPPCCATPSDCFVPCDAQQRRVTTKRRTDERTNASTPLGPRSFLM